MCLNSIFLVFCFQFQGGGIGGGLREAKGACTVMDYADHTMVVGESGECFLH